MEEKQKLAIIENCLCSDIQSIAAQITKLRFFISLIVDCERDASKPNFGIPTFQTLKPSLSPPTLSLLRKSKIDNVIFLKIRRSNLLRKSLQRCAMSTSWQNQLPPSVDCVRKTRNYARSWQSSWQMTIILHQKMQYNLPHGILTTRMQ